MWSGDELATLVLELALACLRCAELRRRLMVLQGAVDDAEARAGRALEVMSARGGDAGSVAAALEALGELARVEGAERAAAGRWAVHVSASRDLARRALGMPVELRGQRDGRPPGRPDRPA